MKMDNEIIKYLSRYIEVTKELEAAIEESVFVRRYTKGTLLLKEGSYSNECYFIFKGCVRCYYLKNGEEKTTEFYTEDQVISPSGYGQKTASEFYLECIEDTIAGVGTPELEKHMYQQFPQLESLNRALGEAIMAKNQDAFAEFKMSSPEERYEHLLKTRPDLIQRVPQYQIASYLGIKPESLSRIRKRLMNS